MVHCLKFHLSCYYILYKSIQIQVDLTQPCLHVTYCVKVDLIIDAEISGRVMKHAWR